MEGNAKFKQGDYCWVIKNKYTQNHSQYLFESIVEVVAAFSFYCVVKDRYGNELHILNESLKIVD